MTEKELWKEFTEKNQIRNETYEAWAFGGFSAEGTDELGHLACIGQKTATASAYPCYADGSEPLPKAGDYSVILDSRGNALCVIQTTKVYIMPFNEVSPEHAYKEGEDGRTLAEWRDVHRKYFSEELQKTGQEFHEDMPVVCEEFQVVYKK